MALYIIALFTSLKVIHVVTGDLEISVNELEAGNCIK